MSVVLLCAGVGAVAAAPNTWHATTVPSRLASPPTLDVWEAVSLGAPLPEDGDQGWFVRRAVAQEFQSSPGGRIAASAGYWDGSTLHYSSGKQRFERDRAGNVITVPAGADKTGQALPSVPVDPYLLSPHNVAALASYRQVTANTPDEEPPTAEALSLGGLSTQNLELIGTAGDCSSSYTTKIAKFGKASLCWRKYRAREDDPTTDYWVYYGKAMAKPHERRFPRAKAYAANVQSGSRMGAAYAKTLGIKGIESHWPQSDMNPTACVNHEASVGMANEEAKPFLTENVSVCEDVSVRENAETGYFAADMRINTRKWSNHEVDHALVHAAVTATGPQPSADYQNRVEWADFHSARFCVTMFNCDNTG